MKSPRFLTLLKKLWVNEHRQANAQRNKLLPISSSQRTYPGCCGASTECIFGPVFVYASFKQSTNSKLVFAHDSPKPAAQRVGINFLHKAHTPWFRGWVAWLPLKIVISRRMDWRCLAWKWNDEQRRWWRPRLSVDGLVGEWWETDISQEAFYDDGSTFLPTPQGF